MSVVLAFDQGTTSSRAIVFDQSGSILGTAQKELTQHYPRPGWIEHDANEIWQSQLQVAREVLETCKVTASDVVAIGITNQRETTLIWDRKTGQPIHPAIVWQDRRTAAFCRELNEAGHADTIRQKTGLLIDPYFAGSKIHWLLENVPGARQRAERGELAFGTIDSWLLWKLTGGKLHASDITNASRTMLMNLESGQWDDELLAILNIPREILPEIYPSSGSYGYSNPDLLGAAIPLGGAAGDQQAALFGQSCSKPGMAKNTYGTGCFVLTHLGNQPVESKSRLLTTAACSLGERREYALEGSIFVAGAVVQWLRDNLGILKSASDIEALASQVEDTGGLYLVPAFTGLGAPHWDPYARGTMIGITRGTTSSHIARAALEGIAFQVADVLEAMKTDASLPIEQLRVDGGAAANDLLLQLQADIIQTSVVRPKTTETTALGAAFLAGLSVGYWNDLEDIENAWQVDRTYEPQITADEAAERRQQWSRAVERAMQWETPDA